MQLSDRVAQKGSFPLVALDEMGFASGYQGEDEARQACPAAEVSESSCRWREEVGQLGTIEDVPLPQPVDVAGSHEIDPAGPSAEKVGISLEATMLVRGKRDKTIVAAIRFHVKRAEHFAPRRDPRPFSTAPFHVKQRTSGRGWLKV